MRAFRAVSWLGSKIIEIFGRWHRVDVPGILNPGKQIKSHIEPLRMMGLLFQTLNNSDNVQGSRCQKFGSSLFNFLYFTNSI